MALLAYRMFDCSIRVSRSFSILVAARAQQASWHWKGLESILHAGTPLACSDESLCPLCHCAFFYPLLLVFRPQIAY